MALRATQLIEELERLVLDRGDAKCQIPDPIECTWFNDVDRVEFDDERETYVLVSDR